MKYETYSEYDPRHAALAESAFLTLWSALGAWHSDLVLVGGLVPKCFFILDVLLDVATQPRNAATQ